MSKRIISLMLTIIFTFVITLGRIAYIMFSGEFAVSSTYNSYTLNIDKLNLTLYDCNLNKLTNNDIGYIAVIRPNEKCLSELNLIFDKDECKEIKDELSKGYPLLKKVEKNDYGCKYIQIEKIKTDNFKNTNVVIKELQNNFSDIVGEKTVNFAVNAKGRLLEGDDGEISNYNYDSSKGVILTLDENVQKIAEECSVTINSGAVIVADVDTCNILACVSKSKDSLNHCELTYPVGSIFKTVVSICAIENGFDEVYECNGKIIVGDTTFTCQKEKAHGKQNLKQGLANSCNCYFINCALKLGKEKIFETAKSLGFGEMIDIESNIKLNGGYFPSINELKSKGELALLGFGQGKLTDSPLHFISVICAIANGGIYNVPNFVLGSVDDNGGAFYNETDLGKRVFKASTSYKLTEYMRFAVSDGTGNKADYNEKSAGKTSTAQTGKFIDENEIYDTWFAGFYPFDNPKYAVVILNENGVSGSADCCPIFRSIVEKLYK